MLGFVNLLIVILAVNVPQRQAGLANEQYNLVDDIASEIPGHRIKRYGKKSLL
jgi:hypothetical protein